MTEFSRLSAADRFTLIKDKIDKINPVLGYNQEVTIGRNKVLRTADLYGSLLHKLRIQPAEAGVALRLAGLLFFATSGAAIGSPGVEAMFFSRFGVEYLPQMYILLGLMIALASLAITALLERVDLTRLYVGMPLVMSVLLVISRLLVALDLRWFYAVLWQWMNVSWTLIGLFCWGIAALVLDPRQAKRLYPLIGAGGILGLTIGGLITRPLVAWIGTENLLWIWAGSLALAALMTSGLVRSASPTRVRRADKPSPLIAGMLQGARFAFSSPLLRWMALAAAFFAVLYYSVVFPFSTGASLAYPNEDALSAFLGSFQGISTLAAFLVSLFLANRIYARFGLMTAILAYPILYLVGFGTLSLIPAAFPALVLFRFTQLVWSEGVSEGANQAMYNLAPPELREKSRLFIRGVANPAGVTLVGLMLYSAQSLPPSAMTFTGFLTAGVTVLLVWKARGAYLAALTEALRVGRQPLLLESDPIQPGFSPLRPGQSGAAAPHLALNASRYDPAVMNALEKGITDPDPVVRRVSAEILRSSNQPISPDLALLGARDPDPEVRAAMLSVLRRNPDRDAAPILLDALNDPEPEVRLEALNALVRQSVEPDALLLKLQQLLADPAPVVRMQAAASLLGLRSVKAVHNGAASENGAETQEKRVEQEAASPIPVPHELPTLIQEAETVIRQLAADPEPSVRAETLRSLVGLKTPLAFELASGLLRDEQAAVRAQAAGVIYDINPQLCIFPLVAALDDESPQVVEAASIALGAAGEAAIQPLIASLNSSLSENGALKALRAFPLERIRLPLEVYARRKQEAALAYLSAWGAVSQNFGLPGSSRRLEIQKNQHPDPNSELESLTVPKASESGSQAAAFEPDTGARRLLADALRHKSREQGMLALQAAALLAGIGSLESRTIELASDRLTSSELEQRSNAVEALELVSQHQLVRPLIPIWEGSASQQPTPGWFENLLEDPSAWIRACTVLAAGDGSGISAGDASGLALMQPSVLQRLKDDDPDELVRETASLAIRKLVDRERGISMETLATLGRMERILFLRRVPIFAELPPNELLQIAGITTEQLCLDGAVVARQGEVGERIYMIVSGEVRIVTRSAKGELEIARARPNDFVGEMSIISQSPHSASLIAAGETRLLTISRTDFEQILRLRPETSLAVMRVLCNRLRGMIAHEMEYHTTLA